MLGFRFPPAPTCLPKKVYDFWARQGGEEMSAGKEGVAEIEDWVNFEEIDFYRENFDNEVCLWEVYWREYY